MSVSIKLKHSSVQDKAPQPTDLTEGELALNINSASPAAYIKDSAGAVVKLAGVGAVGATDATTTSKGVVQLADAAAVTAGTAGRVVDAAQLKVVADAAAAEDLWDRSGTELTPKNAGDDVFTSGDVKVGGTTAAPLAKVNGADGSASFAQRVDVEGIVVANSGSKFAYLRNNTLAWSVDNTFYINNTTRGTIATFKDNGDFLLGVNHLNPTIKLAGQTGAADFAYDVKIGGTLPASPNISLNANGSATFADQVQSIKLFRVGAPGSLSVMVGSHQHVLGTGTSNDGTIYVGSGLDLRYYTNNGERARLTSVGDFILGGSLPTSPNISLKADGSATFAGDMKIGGTLPASPNIQLKADGSATFGSNSFIIGRDGGGSTLTITQNTPATEAFRVGTNAAPANVAIRADGLIRSQGLEVGNSAVGGYLNSLDATGAYGLNPGVGPLPLRTPQGVSNTSDRSLKQNIVDANSQWDDIKALRVRNYQMIANPDVTWIGLIAQEAEEVSPGIVDCSSSIKGIKYDPLTFKMLKALQEALTRIEALEAEVKALKGA